MIRLLTLLSLLLLLGCDGLTSRGETAESEHEGEDEHGYSLSPRPVRLR